MSEPRVRYGQGEQTIRFIPVDRFGRPVRVTAATYTIIDLGEGEDSPDQQIATGAAVLPAVDTTLSASGGAGEGNPRALTLTSTTGVAEGRTYLLSSGGSRSLVVVDGITGSVVTSKDSPSSAYPSGSTFQAIELEALFPLSEANDPDALTEARRYQIAWTYSLHGETHVVCQLVWLVRYDGEAWITETDVIGLYPPLANRVRGPELSIARSIATATQEFIAQLESAGIVAENYRTSTPGQTAIAFRATEYCLRWMGGEKDLALAELFQQRYENIVNNLIIGKPGKAVQLEPVDNRETSARIDALFEDP